VNRRNFIALIGGAAAAWAARGAGAGERDAGDRVPRRQIA
jgi:hypothetical protein